MNKNISIGYLIRTPIVIGKCKEACTEMASVFPELTITSGYVYTASWGRRSHFWLEDPEGLIVDPTKSQFPGGVLDYEPWTPETWTCVGKCMNCGEQILQKVESLDACVSVSVCSDSCDQQLQDYYNKPRESY